MNPGWRVTFAPSGFQIEADPIDDDAELLVTGNASELYVLLWNRRDAAGSEMYGEPDLLDLWRELRRSGGAEDRAQLTRRTSQETSGSGAERPITRPATRPDTDVSESVPSTTSSSISTSDLISRPAHLLGRPILHGASRPALTGEHRCLRRGVWRAVVRNTGRGGSTLVGPGE